MMYRNWIEVQSAWDGMQVDVCAKVAWHETVLKKSIVVSNDSNETNLSDIVTRISVHVQRNSEMVAWLFTSVRLGSERWWHERQSTWDDFHQSDDAIIDPCETTLRAMSAWSRWDGNQGDSDVKWISIHICQRPGWWQLEYWSEFQF